MAGEVSTGGMLSGIGDVVSQGISDVGGQIRQAYQDSASDPCIARIHVQESITALSDKIAVGYSFAQMFSGVGATLSDSIVPAWGAGTPPKVEPGTWVDFASWLNQQAPGAGVAWIRDRLPARNSVSTRNRGRLVAHGIYAYKAGVPSGSLRNLEPGGILTGTAFAAYVRAWTAEMQANMEWKGATGPFSWRVQLAGLTGQTATGANAWRVWIPGTPVQPQSLLGRASIQLAEAKTLLALTNRECEEALVHRQGLEDEALAGRRELPRLAVAGVVLLGVVWAFAGRGPR